MQLRGHGFITSSTPAQDVQIRANEHQLEPARFTSRRQSIIIRRSIPGEVLKGSDILEVEFAISDPASPAGAGMSSDNRELGLGLYWLRILSADD